MNSKGKVLTFFTAVLIVANTGLDYNAICEYFDVEPFKLELFGVGNLIGLIAALAVAVVLFAMAWAAANWLAANKKAPAIALLVACGALSIAVAAFRLSYDAASAGRSISGGMMASLTAADALFAVMLFGALAGESALSFCRQLERLEREFYELAAAKVRFQMDIDSVDDQKASAAKIVNARIGETACAANSAKETVFESALRRAGEMQNSFVGYVEEGKKARGERPDDLEKRLKTMTIPTGDDAGLQKVLPGSIRRSTSEKHQQVEDETNTTDFAA